MRGEFVGRSAEQGLLTGAIRRAAGGHPRSVLVTGEGGAGKSMLLARTSHEASRSGFRVLAMFADRVDRAVPYGSLDAALDDSADEGLDSVRRLRDVIRANEVGRVADRSELVGAAFRTAVEDWTFRSPLLVALDDLHAADRLTQDLVIEQVSRQGRQRLLVVATTRDVPELAVGPAERLDQLRRRKAIERIELGPFDEEELADLVEMRTGRRPGPRLQDLLRRRTGGVPFFAAEVLESVVEADLLSTVDAHIDVVGDDGAVPVPHSVSLSVLHRVFRLGPDARVVASAVAVLGDVDAGRLSLLATLTRLPPTRCDLAFDQLAAAGILTDVGGVHRLRHSIVRDAIYDDIGPAVRRRLHEQAALALADLRAPDERVVLFEIAEHLRRAAGGTDPYAAAIFREVADAIADLAPERAADWYRDALRAMSQDAPEASDVRLRLSRCLDLAGRHHEAAAIALEVLRHVPAGPQRARAAVIAAHPWFSSGNFERAGRLLDAALADPETRSVPLLLHRAQTYFWQERMPEATRCFDEAVELGIGSERAMADIVHLHLLFTGGRYAEALALVDDLTSRLDLVSPASQANVRLSLAVMTAYNLDPQLAVESVSQAPADGPMAGWHRAVLAMALHRQGRLQDAVRHAEAARAAADLVRGDLLIGMYLPVLIAANAELGDLGAADRAHHEAAGTPFVTFPTNVDCARSRLHTIRDQHVEAADLLERCEQREVAAGRINALGMVLGHRVDAAVAADDLGAARAANARLQELPTHPGAVAMSAFQLLGRALSERDLDAADEARQLALRHGLRVEAARALALSGSITATADDLVAAHLELHDLGCRRREQEVAVELRRIGVRPPTRRRPPRRISETERNLAGLVAQGLTNRQIAVRVSLSPKTIETYLSRLYAKTGCSSRVELALLFQKGGLDP